MNQKVELITRVNSKLGLLTLLQIRGVGPSTAISMGDKFQKIEDIVDSFKGIDILVVEDAISKANRILKDCTNFGIEVLTVHDDNFPFFLRNIPQPAPLIYVKGRLQNNNKYIACVGTREPTEAGVKTSKITSNYFSKKGWSIVSGLALGVDSICHAEALNCGGHTVAVLANGLDSIAPKTNSKLAQDILKSGGALISEYPPGTPVYPRNLVIRDRLQSGLSVATIPMQTGIKGGTLHTINFSFLQGRFVVVPVHTKVEEKSEGLKYLLSLATQNNHHFRDPIFPEYKNDLLLPLRSSDLDKVEETLLRCYSENINKITNSVNQMRLL